MEYATFEDFLAHTDFTELMKQKDALVMMRHHNNRPPKNVIDLEHLSGLIHFLDAFQDFAAEQIGNERVFGH